MSSGPKIWKSPLTGISQRDVVTEVDSLNKIQVRIKIFFFIRKKNIIVVKNELITLKQCN